MVARVSSTPKLEEAAPNPIYLIAKYQQLYHLCVCVRYLGSMHRSRSYLEAAQCYELFNYIHGKVINTLLAYDLHDLRNDTIVNAIFYILLKTNFYLFFR